GGLHGAHTPAAQTPLQHCELVEQFPGLLVQAQVPAWHTPLQHGRSAQLRPPSAQAPTGFPASGCDPPVPGAPPKAGKPPWPAAASENKPPEPPPAEPELHAVSSKTQKAAQSSIRTITSKSRVRRRSRKLSEIA